jgi:FKBP-type peptidyl-prolyl cis-trans isomerase SlyD
MLIQKPCVVALSWQLSDAQNHAIDELVDPVEFYFGGDDLLPKLEEAVSGQAVGFQAHLHLEPEHAFGAFDSTLVCFEDRALFPPEVAPGMQFEGLPAGSATPDMPPDAIYTVTEVYPSHVVIDGNHPLAGMALRLYLTVRDVREATAAEIEAGTVGGSVLDVLEVLPATRGMH